MRPEGRLVLPGILAGENMSGLSMGFCLRAAARAGVRAESGASSFVVATREGVGKTTAVSSAGSSSALVI